MLAPYFKEHVVREIITLKSYKEKPEKEAFFHGSDILKNLPWKKVFIDVLVKCEGEYPDTTKIESISDNDVIDILSEMSFGVEPYLDALSTFAGSPKDFEEILTEETTSSLEVLLEMSSNLFKITMEDVNDVIEFESPSSIFDAPSSGSNSRELSCTPIQIGEIREKLRKITSQPFYQWELTSIPSAERLTTETGAETHGSGAIYGQSHAFLVPPLDTETESHMEKTYSAKQGRSCRDVEHSAKEEEEEVSCDSKESESPHFSSLSSPYAPSKPRDTVSCVPRSFDATSDGKRRVSSKEGFDITICGREYSIVPSSSLDSESPTGSIYEYLLLMREKMCRLCDPSSDVTDAERDRVVDLMYDAYSNDYCFLLSALLSDPKSSKIIQEFIVGAHVKQHCHYDDYEQWRGEQPGAGDIGKDEDDQFSDIITDSEDEQEDSNVSFDDDSSYD
ncbi:hypothetical protein ADUPG1_006696 [Aduncisulcus paluster]|uniref:Uncharacterized protein n=1 Tax=Aduncisulcus paluster TaxID=2918883 RepID=A0ABQ5KJ74_9EUKA|nr:hypothetical protein ADUPG1_006696 [Aduncisulcus paluster]